MEEEEKNQRRKFCIAKRRKKKFSFLSSKFPCFFPGQDEWSCVTCPVCLCEKEIIQIEREETNSTRNQMEKEGLQQNGES